MYIIHYTPCIIQYISRNKIEISTLKKTKKYLIYRISKTETTGLNNIKLRKTGLRQVTSSFLEIMAQIANSALVRIDIKTILYCLNQLFLWALLVQQK